MIKFSIDTRTLQPGEHYVAIRGERYDGHDFVPDAIARGAAGLVLERALPGIPSHVEVRQVQDSVDYLARQARQRIADLRPTIVAITGSVGKTTTKNAIVTVLRQALPVVAPQGNWNTLLGLSLTVLNELTEPDRKFVVEVGTYGRGEIAQICEFIPPSIAVVTNVRPVHMERMGTLENIARAKGELVEALSADGVACLNWDDPRVRAMCDLCRGRTVFYGAQAGASVTPERISARLPLLGDFQTYTALAAFCVGQCLGLPDELLNQGLAQLQPEKGRLVKLPGLAGSTLLDDTYNAAPSSTLAALEVLRQQKAARRVAFLGDMLELGSAAEDGHRQVLQRAVQVADQVVLAGPRMSLAAQELDAAQAAKISTFEESTDVVAALQEGQVYQPQPGDWVLLKGSAGMRMERIARFLLNPELDASRVLVRQEASWQS